jgi:hypothetical protein
VTDHWLKNGATNGSGMTGEHHVLVDDTLPESRSLMLLEPVGGDGILSLTSALADRLGLTGQASVSADALARALDVAAVKLDGADYLFARTQDVFIRGWEPAKPLPGFDSRRRLGGSAWSVSCRGIRHLILR